MRLLASAACRADSYDAAVAGLPQLAAHVFRACADAEVAHPQRQLLESCAASTACRANHAGMAIDHVTKHLDWRATRAEHRTDHIVIDCERGIGVEEARVAQAAAAAARAED